MILRLFLCGCLWAVYANVQGLTLSLHGEHKQLYPQQNFVLQASLSQVQAPVLMDVYFSVQFPSGERYYFPKLNFVSLRNVATPLLSQWHASDVARNTLLNLPLSASLPVGLYKWTLLAVKAGQDAGDIRQWLAQTTLNMELLADENQSTLKLLSTLPFTLPLLDQQHSDSQQQQNLAADVDNNAPTLLNNIKYFASGEIDDNLNLTAFQYYLDGMVATKTTLPAINVADRIGVHLIDRNQRDVAGATIRLYSDNNNAPISSVTGHNGVVYFYPTLDHITNASLQIEVSYLGKTAKIQNKIQWQDLRQRDDNVMIELVYPEAIDQQPTVLDVMWVIDTTGKMEDELRYLNLEWHEIMASVQQWYPELKVRYGLRLYRDEGDAYVVRDFPFTSSLTQFLAILSDQKAAGGGDYPEAMVQALDSGLSANWSAEQTTVKLLFLITDAPPHEADLPALLPQINRARQNGIHVHTIAASGTDDNTAYILRSIAALTQGRYIFLSDSFWGQTLQSEAGVLCYQVSALKNVLQRVLISEIQGQRQEAYNLEIYRVSGDFNQGRCVSNAVNTGRLTDH